MNLYSTLREALQEVLDLPAEEADRLALQVIQAGAKHIGGDRVYWPARAPHPPREEVKERNAAIREEFNGRNLQEICRRYRVSHTTVYRVVSR